MTSESDVERVLIQHTMQELLGRDFSERRPTVAELLRLTSLARWKLTHRHRDLNDAFLGAVARKWGTEAGNSAMARDYQQLREKYKRLRKEHEEARLLVQAYAEIIEEQRILNAELLQDSSAKISSIERHRDRH
jgi:hypothetical protein